jgi:hypothetical protein
MKLTRRQEHRQFTDFILTKFGLLKIIDDTSTTEPVVVAVTFDGGSISQFVGHVTGGYKLVDKRCVNPKTNQLLFGISGNEKVQSHIHCFPIFAKDTKQLYQVGFGDFIQFLKEYKHSNKVHLPTGYVIHLEDNRPWWDGESQDISLLLLFSNFSCTCHTSAKE